MNVCPGRRSSYPSAGAIRKGDASIERQGEFQGDERPARTPSHEIAGKALLARLQWAEFSRDTCCLQALHAPSGSARIGILHPHDHSPWTGSGKEVGAGRTTPAFMRAWFERYENVGTACGLACFGQSHCLGVGAPAWLGPAATDGSAIANDQAADGGIGIGRRPPAPCEACRRIQPLRISRQGRGPFVSAHRGSQRPAPVVP